MALAFRHVDSGTVHIVAEADGYAEPDWEGLPDPPEGSGPWVFVDGAWAPDIDPMLIHIRAERDARLKASDWTRLDDVPEETREAWQPYRQALRDMPETADPFAPEWPNPPA